MPAVERRVGILEDDLQRTHVVPAPLRELRCQHAVLELDRARRRRDEPEQGARERRLAAPRLPHEPQRLSGPDRRRDALEGVHRLPALLEDLPQLLEPDERLHAPVDDRKLEIGGFAPRELARALVEVAAARVTRGHGVRWGVLHGADRLSERAAVGEDAPRPLLAEVRQKARNRVEPAVVLADAPARDAADEPDGVRMTRVAQHSVRVALLHEAPRVEHPDALAHLRDHSEVVADEEHRGLELALQVRDQIEHLGLDGRVESCRGLVEDQQGRVLRERHRDDHALLHPTRELMRVALQDRVRVRDLHSPQDLERVQPCFLPGHASDGEDLCAPGAGQGPVTPTLSAARLKGGALAPPFYFSRAEVFRT